MSDSSPTATGLLTATSTDVHWRRSDSDSECLIPVVPPKFSDKLNVRAAKFTLPTMCLRTILVAILPAKLTEAHCDVTRGPSYLTGVSGVRMFNHV